MIKFIVFLVIALGLSIVKADTISLDVYAMSKHNKGNFNETHKWRGVQYGFYKTDNLELSIHVAKFKNSRLVETEVVAIDVVSYPLNLRSLEIGAKVSIGVQRGYCFSKMREVACDNPSNSFKPMALPSASFRYKKVTLDVTVMPNVTTGMISVEVLSW